MLRFITSLAFLIFAQAAVAQNQPPSPFVPPAVPPTDLASGIGNYCIYESLIYSIGSPLWHWQDKLHMRSDNSQCRVRSAGVLDDQASRSLIAPACQ
jgi:hypothetical protein